jgi:putative FmdB family regulatory protein
MPIYEFRCSDCKRRTSVFVRSVTSRVDAACEHCRSKKLTRLLSKFAVHKGAPSLDDDGAFDNVDENDPRAVARMMRQMGEESGEDMGSEFEEMVGRMEAGESADSVMADSEYGDEGGFGGDDDDF